MVHRLKLSDRGRKGNDLRGLTPEPPPRRSPPLEAELQKHIHTSVRGTIWMIGIAFAKEIYKFRITPK